MVNPWLALESGADPTERCGQVRRAHEAFVVDGSVNGQVRDVVAASWRRSARALVDPDRPAPIDLDSADVTAYRTAHPLSRVLPVVRDLLGGVIDDGQHLVAICDADARLLWVEGHGSLLRRAERMNFVTGARWDEPHAGTNAPGTALAVDHAVQIFATEHFSRQVQPWTCVAAPVHHPYTGELLGAIDLTSGDQLANPHSLALVQATARAAEALLAGADHHRPSGHPPTPPIGAGRPMTLSVLGRDEGLLAGDGRDIRLSRRHSEILVLLARHPEGLSGDRLGLDLYGDDGLHPVTLRAELTRLRRVLGPDVLDSRPYRLRVPIEVDFQAMLRALEQGRIGAAVRMYRGPLLPASDAPAVVQLRRLIDGQTRTGILAVGDPALLDAWTRAPWGEDDLLMWQAIAEALPADSPRRPLVLDRVRRLAAEYGPGPAGRRGHATWLQRRGS
jgi:hypothetical protein